MNNKGFTLIELVATIAILSLIAMISFVSITGIISSNKKEQCENLIKSIKSAAKEWVSDNRYSNNLGNGSGEYSLLVSKLDDYLNIDLINPYTNEKINDSDVIIFIDLDNYSVSNVRVTGLDCS